MTNPNPPAPDVGMERAVEAALPIIRIARCGSNELNWCDAGMDCRCRVATTILITTADRARGRPSGKDVADRIIRTLRDHDWSVGMDGPDSLSTELRQLIIAAWAERPALPAWSEPVCKESLRTDEPRTLARTATDGEDSLDPAPPDPLRAALAGFFAAWWTQIASAEAAAVQGGLAVRGSVLTLELTSLGKAAIALAEGR